MISTTKLFDGSRQGYDLDWQADDKYQAGG